MMADSWSLPSVTAAELERRKRTEEQRQVLVRLGLLVGGVPVRRRLAPHEVASAKLVGLDIDEHGRLR